MFIDGRTLDGSVQEAALCIVGAGAAGITIACELEPLGMPIIMVESGDLKLSNEAQALNKGTNTGLRYSLANSRTRGFGGTTRRWGGMCAPLSASDFHEKPWVPDSGWPFGLSELMPYYRRASVFLNIGGSNETDFTVDPEMIPDSSAFEFHCWRHAANLRFRRIHEAFFEQSSSIRVLLNTTIVNIEARKDLSRVVRLDAATLSGQRFTIRAKYYILACGGIENARLLLLSRNQAPAGLGNTHDLVGRYFMEHPHATIGKLYTFGQPEILRRFERSWDASDPTRVIYNITPSWKTIQQHQILNSSIEISAKEWVVDKDTFTNEKPLVNPPSPVGYMQRILKRYGSGVYQLTLYSRSEQAPNRDSLVKLSTDITDMKDAFGLPVVRLHWKLGEQEWRTIRMLSLLLSQRITVLGLGTVQFYGWLNKDVKWAEDLRGGAHHMGTTRMHDDPRHGVVDAKGKLHGVKNLYIAGSSVFPTSGWANPTYTIIAMAIRLADTIKSELSPPAKIKSIKPG